MIFPVKKIQPQTRVLPQFLPTQSVFTKPIAKATTDLFNVLGNRFAALVQKENVNAIKAHLIEIDINEEIALLKEEHALEISVPMLGVVDLLNVEQFTKNVQQFACPVAINGFGAKSAVALNNFPRPDFVLITDIAGNQYEVIVNQDGKIELPDDGTGLFSIVSTITYIYSERQLKHGDGFENLQAEGIALNKLFLLPPIGCQETFKSQICVTHIDKRHKRIVDTIRKVEVKYAMYASENASNLLIHEVYSEYDFMKDYLKGDIFNFSHQNGYNNFLLMPEAFSRFYDLLLHDLIHCKLTGDVALIDHQEKELPALPVTSAGEDVAGNLWAQFSDDSLTLAHLSPEQLIHKSGIYNSIDLSQVLESASVWTPMMASAAKEVGKQVDIITSMEKNEPVKVKPEVKARPSTKVEIDPNFHTRR